MGKKQFLIPLVGLELEFYLLKNGDKILSSDPLIDQFITDFSKILDFEIIKEQGAGQIEVKTKPSSNLDLIDSNLDLIKKTSSEIAKNLNLKTDFSAQPFIDDCGSALQINLSLIDEQNQNLFAKNNDKESEILLNSIAGILEFTDQIITSLNLNEKDFLRHDLELNRNLFKNKKYTAPVNISWGYDNRTCLIRIPRVKNQTERRLEYRLAPANANFKALIEILLEAVFCGIDKKLNPPEVIYGNAFDYELKNIRDYC